MVSLASSRRRPGRALDGDSRCCSRDRRGGEPMKIRTVFFLSALPVMLLAMTAGLRAQQQDLGPSARRVIIFVWDGLRADDLIPEITPNYFVLARSGVVFADHHAVYPTFTMMNSASIATGTY